MIDLDGLRHPKSLSADPSVVLRPTTLADAPDLRAFYMASRQPDFPGLPSPLLATILDVQFRARALGYAQAFPDLATLVMRSADALIGHVAIAHDPADRGAVRIVDIMVAAEWRGRGFGSASIGHLADAARAAGFSGLTLEVALNNIAARRLYTRLGFVAVSPTREASNLSFAMRRSPL